MIPGRTETESPDNRADALFLAALEIENPEMQRAFLDSACAGDAEVRAKVDRLFASLEKSRDFFADGSPTRITAAEISRTLTELPGFFENLKAPLPDDAEVGRQIGPYKLLQKIGEGSVGTVYLAEQEKPVRRQVALKIIKRGMDTRSVIARFGIERQALALMEHPNIAHVIDAGETETGRPFFVMELVHGVRITTYCDENRLDIRRRLELLIQVCRAIQHAHQKGIIHRDIKPSNLLVSIHDGIPMPKVIDFGIAKAACADAEEGGDGFTRIEPFVGTPAYMSPEQAQPGVDVDTRSDIYSLGVVLYELLAGAPPFDGRDLMKSGSDGMRQALGDREPLRPSIRLQRLEAEDRRELARLRGLDDRRLQALLGGDLDWIVMKALEKDRNRRYETVDAFAMDLERFLNNEPVLARPPSRGYRFCKMVLRNRGAFAAGTAIGLVLLAWLATASWLFIREHEARMRAVSAEQEQQRLRVEAEDREHITQAAFLISQGRLEEADALADRVSVLTPSLEAESVLRTLGEWHALNGRWQESAARFRLLLKVDIKDSSWAITDDLLMAGPILIEQGDIPGYELFRRAALEKYRDTTAWVFAERTLKVCLLQPVDEILLQSLQPLAELVREGSLGEMKNDGMKAWGGISMALMSLRRGDAEQAIDWCRRCRTCADENPARIAMSNFIHAMAASELGNDQTAGMQLEQGRSVIDVVFSRPLIRGSGIDGFWYDWIYARILMREAESRLHH